MFEKAEKFLKNARLKLSGAKYRFFGLCLYMTRIKFFTNDVDPCEGFVRIDKNKNQYENVIYINSDMIDKHEDYSTYNMIDILLHEWNHIVRRHDVRRGERDNRIWNVACDHVIDSFLKKLNISKPIVGWNILKTIPKEIRIEEDIYNWLLKNSNKVTVTVSKNGKVTVTESDGNSFTVDLDLEGKSLSPEQKQVVESYISQVRAMYSIEKERGNIGSDLAETFDELLKVTIPWDRILEKAIKNKAFEKSVRRNWKTPNKLLYPGSGRYLPGRTKIENNVGIGTLLVHIDSSGSMSDTNLKKAGYVISASAKYFNKIELVIADIEIHQQKTFMKNNFNEVESYFSREGVKGRGGTSHKMVFDHWDEYVRKNRDEVSMMISITDMYSDIDTCINSFKAVKFIPLIFISESDSGNINSHENVTVIKID